MTDLAAVPQPGDPHTQELVDALADCVTKAVEYGQQDDGFVAFYLLPTGPLHRAITLLQERHGVTVRPGFDVQQPGDPHARLLTAYLDITEGAAP